MSCGAAVAIVEDSEVVLAYTPEPLQRIGAADALLGRGVAGGAVGRRARRRPLADRGGVPLGRYRFHVEGKGWTLDSAPFDVVGGGLTMTASRVGTAIHSVVKMHAPKGWRLLDMNLKSNQPIPVSGQPVTIQVRNGMAVLSSTTANTDASGGIDVLDNVSATNIHVIDPYGNAASASL